MKEVEPLTHYLALGVIILVSGFFAVMSVGMALYGKEMEEDFEEPEYEDGEIDATYYPNDEDSVIFPK